MNRLRRSTTTPDRRSVTIGGIPVYFRDTGTEGPPLVLLHGLSGSTRWWDRNIAALSAYFRVYALDLPGFGENRRWCQFQLADAPARFLAWMDALELRQASVIGHSMGGVIATEVALRDPRRIARLVLADSPLVLDPRSWLRFGVSSLVWARYLPPDFVPVLLFDVLRAGPRTILRGGRAVRLTDLQDRLRELTTPTLVVWGEFDGLFPPAYGRRVAAALPDAPFVQIDGAGHNPMWDRPEGFNRVVLDFLTRPAPRTGRRPSPTGQEIDRDDTPGRRVNG